MQYGYNENGNRISMTDPNENTTLYDYDELNRLITTIEPKGSTTRYQYDAVGNLFRLTRPNGDTIQYSYDTLDRLETITYPDSSTVTFLYDENGNRIQMLDKLGTHSYTYDALNRMTAHDDPFGNSVGYAYDKNSNRKTLTYPGNKVVSYGFDKANRMKTVTDWLSNITSYNYDDAGRLIDVANPNGTTTNYGYDNANRLTSLSNAKSDSSIISSYTYTLDAIGKHKQEERNEPLVPILSPRIVLYNHDAENRLTDVNGTANLFDTNGNMTDQGTDSYLYNHENRLTQTTLGGITTQYQYDGMEERYLKTRSGSTTRYILDINTSLTNVLAETDSSNNITTYNIYGLGLIARIQPNGAAYYYHYDSRGSTIALTNASGTTTDMYAYDPFGKLANRSGATANPFTSLGRHGVMDEGDDLLYIRARYYDSEQQRFINKDAKAGNDRDGQSLNRYIYGLNSPIVLIDVSGFSPREGSSDPNLLNNRLLEVLDLEIFTANVLSAVKGSKDGDDKLISEPVTKEWWKNLPGTISQALCDYVFLGLCGKVEVIKVSGEIIDNYNPVIKDIIDVETKGQEPIRKGTYDFRMKKCGTDLDCIFGKKP